MQLLYVLLIKKYEGKSFLFKNLFFFFVFSLNMNILRMNLYLYCLI